jgi:hypothetical protein
MKALGRIASALVLIASISSAATAQPGKFNQCYELTVARGYTNRAPGEAQFLLRLHASRSAAGARDPASERRGGVQ